MSVWLLGVFVAAALCLGMNVLECARGAGGVVTGRLGWRWLGVVRVGRDREFVFDDVQLSPVHESGKDEDDNRVDRSHNQVVLKSSSSWVALDEGWRPPEAVAARLRAFLADRSTGGLQLKHVNGTGLFWAVFLIAAGLFFQLATAR